MGCPLPALSVRAASPAVLCCFVFGVCLPTCVTCGVLQWWFGVCAAEGIPNHWRGLVCEGRLRFWGISSEGNKSLLEIGSGWTAWVTKSLSVPPWAQEGAWGRGRQLAPLGVALQGSESQAGVCTVLSTAFAPSKLPWTFLGIFHFNYF